MNLLKKKALNLRLQGYSYNELNKKFGIPKSTLSCWFSNLKLSTKALDRLKNRYGIGVNVLIERNKMQTVRAWDRVKKIRAEARDEIQNSVSKNRDLLLIATALYWGEGYKKLLVKNGKNRTGHVVSLTNSDPDIVRTFVVFLNRYMKIPLKDIQLALRLYESINEKEALNYWLKITGLPKESIREITYLVSISSKRKRPYNRLPYGTVQIRMNDTQKFHRIMGWIDWMKDYMSKIKTIKKPE